MLQKNIYSKEIGLFVAFVAGPTKQLDYQPIPMEAKTYTESGLQAACHTWFHNTFTAFRGLGFMIHNDGVKNPIHASQDKARGLVGGIPDWVLMVPRCEPGGVVGALFIEFKVGFNGVDALQRKRHAQLRAQGYRVEVVRSLADFQGLLTAYLA